MPENEKEEERKSREGSSSFEESEEGELDLEDWFGLEKETKKASSVVLWAGR